MESNKILLPVIIGAVTSAIAVVAIVLTTKLLGPLPLAINQTTTEKQSAFNVQGESEIVTVPDTAQIRLGIQVKRDRIQDAQNEANSIMNNVTEQIKGMGVDRKHIRTQSYNVYPEYDYQNSDRRITGYSVNINMVVELTDFEKVNDIIDMATANGINQVGGISFTLSKTKEEELRKQAREEAIENAKANAEELAGLAGMKLGKIINVMENNNNSVPQDYGGFLSNSLPLARDESTQVQPGSTEFNYSVTLSYETY